MNIGLLLFIQNVVRKGDIIMSSYTHLADDAAEGLILRSKNLIYDYYSREMSQKRKTTRRQWYS